MSIFGISPLGTGPGPAGGPGLISVLGILPLSNNKWVVVFDVPPAGLDTDAVDSGTNEENYTLEAINPEIVAENGDVFVPPGEFVPTRFPYTGLAEIDFEDPTQVICSADSQLQQKIRYQVTVSTSICGANGETFAGPNVFQFQAPLLSPGVVTSVEVSEQRFRDLDYLIVPTDDQPAATYFIESTGDIGIQNAETSLRKRISRRIFSQPGSFSFLPQYGIGMAIKKLAKAGQLQDLSNRVAAQIQLEPDVSSAGVEVFTEITSEGAFVQVEVRVEQRDDRERRFVFREPLA